jgi:hypothetical protein
MSTALRIECTYGVESHVRDGGCKNVLMGGEDPPSPYVVSDDGVS